MWRLVTPRDAAARRLGFMRGGSPLEHRRSLLPSSRRPRRTTYSGSGPRRRRGAARRARVRRGAAAARRPRRAAGPAGEADAGAAAYAPGPARVRFVLRRGRRRRRHAEEGPRVGRPRPGPRPGHGRRVPRTTWRAPSPRSWSTQTATSLCPGPAAPNGGRDTPRNGNAAKGDAAGKPSPRDLASAAQKPRRPQLQSGHATTTPQRARRGNATSSVTTQAPRFSAAARARRAICASSKTVGVAKAASASLSNGLPHQKRSPADGCSIALNVRQRLARGPHVAVNSSSPMTSEQAGVWRRPGPSIALPRSIYRPGSTRRGCAPATARRPRRTRSCGTPVGPRGP